MVSNDVLRKRSNFQENIGNTSCNYPHLKWLRYSRNLFSCKNNCFGCNNSFQKLFRKANSENINHMEYNIHNLIVKDWLDGR